MQAAQSCGRSRRSYPFSPAITHALHYNLRFMGMSMTEFRFAQPWLPRAERTNEHALAATISTLTASLLSSLGVAEAARSGSAKETHVETYGVYTADLLTNATGGLETGFRYLDNLELGVQADQLFASGRFRDRAEVVVLYNNRTTAGELVGDLQGVSNIDAAGDIRVFQAWYELSGRDLSLRAGLYDLNSEFDSGEAGSFFINSSHGIGPDIAQTGENGPGIFPVSALAMRLKWQNENLKAKLVVMDGVPGDPADPRSNEVRLSSEEGALIVAEADVEPGGRARLWAGAWHYTATFDSPFEPVSSDDNSGWYLGYEHRFRLAGRDMHAFVRVGGANEDLNPIRDYFGSGVVVEAPFQARPDDQFGIAVASAGMGRPYREQLEASGERATRRETILELNYRGVLSDRFVVQPDLQWIVSPAGRESVDDALVFTLRLEWTLLQ